MLILGFVFLSNPDEMSSSWKIDGSTVEIGFLFFRRNKKTPKPESKTKKGGKKKKKEKLSAIKIVLFFVVSFLLF